MNSSTMGQRVLACADAIRDAELEYRRCIEISANAERAYKRREAIALTSITEAKNADDRRAQAELLAFEDGNTVGDLRYAARLADGLRDSAKQALRNRAAELSVLQSEAALAKEEARFLTSAPREAVPA